MISAEEKRARFERALHCGGDTHGIEDVVAAIKAGHAKYWEAGDGCIVTECVQFPRLKAIRYWLISGDLQDCLSLDAPITEWALNEGCTIGVASGRRGWQRAGAPYGWRLHGYEFVKDLRP